MSQAEELLNDLATGLVEHEHTVADSDSYFVIDPSTRQIESTARKKNILFVGDHNSEVYTFELPRYIERHDMLLCTSVKVHYNNIDGETGDENSSVVDLYDLRINPANPETVICSWTIKRQVIQLVGILSFALQYLCADNEGNITYEWHTDSYDEVDVKAGRNYSERAVFEYTDILEQWRARIFGAADSIKSEFEEVSNAQQELIKEEGSKQMSAIENKGAEVLLTIPDEYTDIYNMSTHAVRNNAGAIVVTANGEIIQTKDSSDNYIRDLHVYGRTKQHKTQGLNLLPFNETFSRIDRGVAVVVGDGKCRLAGKSTAESGFNITLMGLYTGEDVLFTLDAGTYTVSDCVLFNYDGKSHTPYSGTFTITESLNITWVSTRTITVDEEADETLYPMVNVGSEAIEWEPYSGEIESPSLLSPQTLHSIKSTNIVLMGRNLAYFGEILSAPKTVNGVTSSLLSDGRILITGTPTVTGIVDTIHSKALKDDTIVRWARYRTENCSMQVKWADGNTTWTRDLIATDQVLSINAYVQPRSEYFEDGGTISPLMWIEDLKPEKFVAGSETQAINIPYELSAIPVSKNGNYTDSNGQQWIADEIDFERGVYIKRIRSFMLDSSMTASYDSGIVYYGLGYDSGMLNTPILCSHDDEVYFTATAGGIRFTGFSTVDEFKDFISTNEVVVQYVLATPVETPLTDEEVYLFKQLHSNYPVTNAMNSENAYVSLSYNADTKTYIDNKFAELAKLITT